MLGSYLVLRYTKPLYESRSTLKLDIKSEASILGLNNYDEEQSYNNLMSEIELIKSKLFFNKIINALDLDISVYTIGNILVDERYKNAPFDVGYKIKDPVVFDKPFRIEILNPHEFNLSYTVYNRQFNRNYSFGDIIDSDYFTFKITPTVYFEPESRDKEFFFTINSRQSLLDYIENNIGVEPLKLNTNTIEISFKDYNQLKARDMVNAIDTIYLTYTKEEKTKANSQKVEFLNEQLSSTESKLSDFEDYFENFIVRNKTTDLEDNLNKTISLLNDIDSQRYDLQIKLTGLMELSSRLDSGKQINLGITEYRILPLAVRNDIQELNRLLEESESILLSYNKNTQVYRKRSGEIDQIYGRISEFINKYIKDIKDQLRDLAMRKSRLERNFVELPSKNTEYSKSQRYYSLYEEFYLTLMQKKAEFQLAMAGTVTDFKILSSATFPEAPIKPKKWMIYSIAGIGWFFLSFFIVGIGYLSFNKITGLQEVERLTDIPVLGAIPFFTGEKSAIAKLVVDRKSHSAISEAFRSLRTNMQFVISGNKGMIVSISSTVSGEGKTFVGLNEAAVFALSNKRVLIVDLDLRKPKLDKVFEHVTDRRGISTVLAGMDKINDCIVSSGLENLDLLPSGPVPPNPSELMMSPEMNNILNQLREKYDLIILDTPPIGIVTDGVLAMKKSDVQLFIFRADYSKSQFINYLEKTHSIHKFPHLYIILNAVKNVRGVSYGYGYGSGYYHEKG